MAALVLAGILGACGVLEPPDPLAELAFHAEGRVEDGDIWYSLFVLNLSREEVELSAGWDARVVSVRAYDERGSPRWDMDIWLAGTVPSGALVTWRMAPREGVTIPGRLPIAAILGDSLPEGPYRLVAVPEFHQPVPQVEVPMGELVLTREPHP